MAFLPPHLLLLQPFLLLLSLMKKMVVGFDDI
jgi:hypothetical protein